jgi:hypothetical protein
VKDVLTADVSDGKIGKEKGADWLIQLLLNLRRRQRVWKRACNHQTELPGYENVWQLTNAGRNGGCQLRLLSATNSS